MNNNIVESYCSFEVSKLLKEKGFDCNCNLFMKEGEDEQHPTYGHNSMHGNIRVYIPRHALAIKWIRENYQLSIEIVWKNTGKVFFGTIYPMSPLGGIIEFTGKASTYEEASEAAILYTLQNLIS